MATYYVDPDGDDGDNGGIGDPWASLSYACSEVLGSGDIIHVNAGTYYESNECVLAEGVSIVGEGDTSHIISTYTTTYTSNSASITLYSSNQGTDGNQSISYIKLDGDSLDGDYAIKVIKRSNVIIHHCTIVDFFIGGVAFWGQGYSDSTPIAWATGNQLHDCFIQNCGDMSGNEENNGNSVSGAGMVHIGTVDGMLIYNNTLDESVRPGHNGNILSAVWYYKNIRFYNNICIKPAFDGEGVWNFMMEIPAGNSCYGGFEAYDNEFYGSNCVWDLGGDYVEKGIYDYTFYIHDNYFDADDPTGSESGKMAIDIEGLMNTDVWIRNNRFNNWPRAIVIDQGGGSSDVSNIWIESNLIVNSGMTGDTNWQDIVRVTLPGGSSSISNLYIHNNVITPNSYTISTAIKIDTNCPVNNVNIKNNIITGHQNSTWLNVINGDSFDGLDISNNCLYDNMSNDPEFSGNAVTNYSIADNVEEDPLFVSAGDYHLQAESPCIGAGIDVDLLYDYAGNLYDDPPSIGAYEYGVVEEVLVTNITVTGAGSATTITIDDGTLQMSAHIDPHDATDQTVTWSVINETGSATINATGLLTAVTDGTVTVRATANDGSAVYGELEITISNQVTGLTLLSVCAIVNPANNTLLGCFADAVDTWFDPVYKGNKDRLSNFTNYPIGTWDDWFLPSRDELEQIYLELYLHNIGNIPVDVEYWSSTEIDATQAYAYDMEVGSSVVLLKASSVVPVRACRIFTSTNIYALRDEGPSGGFIFIVTNLGGGIYEYYEAAPSDLWEASTLWSNIDNTEIGITAQGIAIGTGQSNTTAIIGQSGHTDSAAKLCDDLVV